MTDALGLGRLQGLMFRQSVIAGLLWFGLAACSDGTEPEASGDAGGGSTGAGPGGVTASGAGGSSAPGSGGANGVTDGTVASATAGGVASAATAGGLGPGGSGGSGGSGGALGGTGEGGATTGDGGAAGMSSAGFGGTSGGGGNGGVAGSGAGGSAGSESTGGPCAAPVASTSTRPQLSDAEAENYTVENYLAKAGPFASLTTDNWNPTAELGDASAFTADITVASDSSGDYASVQSALNAVSGSQRRYVLVKPGTYRGQVSYTGSTPVTLYGGGTDADEVVIINSRSAAEGTSQTLNVVSSDFQIVNLTLSNDFPTPTSGSNIQALALFTRGDKIVLQDVNMHGFQDTVQFSAANATTVNRVYVKGGFIEGDTDFIYGNATVVLDGVTVHYLSSRRGTGTGIIIAPSTSVDNPLGFLFIGCNFSADQSAPSDHIFLGRSWDASSTTPTPNGQGVIRNSTLGAHIDRNTPWTSAATSARPYSASDNRFYEYCNSGPGASP